MKEITITIPRSDINFDVDAATHIFANVTEISALQRADTLESDTDDAAALAVVSRFADRRVAEMKRQLARFINPAEKTSDIATISTAATYEITLYVEDAFLEELTTSVAAEMEAYISTGVICDWYNTVGDAQSQNYAAQLPVILNRLTSLIVARKIPSRS